MNHSPHTVAHSPPPIPSLVHPPLPFIRDGDRGRFRGRCKLPPKQNPYSVPVWRARELVPTFGIGFEAAVRAPDNDISPLPPRSGGACVFPSVPGGDSYSQWQYEEIEVRGKGN